MTRPPKTITRLIDRNHLPFLANELGLATGIEIGTWKAEYAVHLLTHWGGKLWTVDPWEQQPESEYRDGCNVDCMEQIMMEALESLNVYIVAQRCEILRMKSLEASKRFTAESLGFVYLDGNHAEEVVASEIRLFWPLIQSGGILGGHDAYHREDEFQRGGVIDAVLDFAEEIGVRPHITNCTSWWFQK
jgi:hypothetical protein